MISFSSLTMKQFILLSLQIIQHFIFDAVHIAWIFNRIKLLFQIISTFIDLCIPSLFLPSSPSCPTDPSHPPMRILFSSSFPRLKYHKKQKRTKLIIYSPHWQDIRSILINNFITDLTQYSIKIIGQLQDVVFSTYSWRRLLVTYA